jgi:hypothetical protein
MARLQICQHGQYPIKENDVVLVGHVVMAVTLTQFWVFLDGHIWRSMGQCLHQSQANHIGGSFTRGLLATHIHDGTLNTPRDDGR